MNKTMDFQMDRSSSVPLYRQIAEKIEDQILSGELSDGFKLPAERRLAAEIGVHRNTVIKAYDMLITDGLVVVSREKPKGYFVNLTNEAQKFGKRFFPLEKGFRYEFRKAEKKFNEVYWKSEKEDAISFGGMLMRRDLDPVKNMDHIAAKMFDCSAKGSMQGFYDETELLRDNICRLLAEQNIYVMPKNVQILAETNQIISYLVMLYLREGDCIIAESPMVPDNFSIFYNRGIHVVSIPMDDDGMRMDLLEEAIRRYKPKFIYTIPNYHNPTGTTMSLNRRRTLLKLANDYNVPVIEEDYQKDFAYEKRLPSLYTLDTNKLVIYIYSFTLIFPYMMKIGYAVGPSDLMDMLGYALSVDETAVSGIGQYFLNEYIRSGQYANHVKVVGKEYKEKLDLLCKEIDKLKDKGISYKKPKGGLLLWCTLTDDINERLLCSKAAEKGVLLIPGWVFYGNDKKKSGHIRLCFSNVTDDQIRRGVWLLGQSLDECRQQTRKEKENGKGERSVKSTIESCTLSEEKRKKQ